MFKWVRQTKLKDGQQGASQYIKMPPYQYRDSQFKDKTSFYLHDGNPTDRFRTETGNYFLSATCEAIDVDICAEYLPYSNTKLPNLLGDATQLDAQNAISATLAKVDTHCFETAARFFCALYFPRCDDGGTVTQVCRSNCDGGYINYTNVKWSVSIPLR